MYIYFRFLDCLKKNTIIITFLLIIGILYNVRAQESFKLYGKHRGYTDVKFQLINNLIVIPLEINGKPLNFIFDTGVNKTIVFNSLSSENVFLNDKRIYKLRGLGGGNPVDAVISENNTFRLNKLVGKNQKVYIVLKDEFDLSSKMGITIHGVIGYDILKDLVLKMDYRKKRIRFYESENFKIGKCKKCQEFPLQIHRNKPFIDVNITVNEGEEKIPVKMLIDSGGSDAIWLFEYSKEGIVTPEKHFDDFLGVGLSGTIYGKRSRISDITIGTFKIPEPSVSFLDTISTRTARSFKERNGSIGNNILKRFTVWFDYPNNKITLKKSAPFTGGFNYNMSGIEVVYNGKVLIPVRESRLNDGYGRDTGGSSGTSINLVTNYVYRFKPSYRVNEVIKGSPAALAGVKKGDIILNINGKPTHQLSLNKIISIFQEKNKKLIRMTIQRDQERIKIEFRLKKVV